MNTVEIYKRLRDTEALLAVACFLISLTVLDRDPLTRLDILVSASYWISMVFFGLRSWASHRKLRALRMFSPSPPP